MKKMKTGMHDNESAHISRNENFKVLALLEAAEKMSKRNWRIPIWVKCLSNNQ